MRSGRRPRATTVPARVREPLLVGLRAEPDRRHASMNALLQALETGLAPRWRAILATLAGAGLVIAGALGACQVGGHASEPPCTGSEQLVSGIWDPPRRRALETAFRATGSPLAAFTTGEVTRRLDRYAKELVVHRDACAATQIRREQSQAMQELRTRCVDQRLRALRALTGLFVQADTQIVHNAVTAAGSLPGIADCGDAAALQQVQPEPVDPGLRTRIAALRPALAQIRALDIGTAEALYAIGDVRSFQFKAAEAVHSYQRALAIYEHRLGAEHPR